MAAELSIPPASRLVLDTSVLVAYLSADEPVSAVARTVLDDLVRTGHSQAVVSTLALSELLVHPARAGVARGLAFELLEFPNLTFRSVDVLIAAEAARIRALTAIRLADATILATGMLTSSDWLVTNDAGLARAATNVVPEMSVCLLSDHA